MGQGPTGHGPGLDRGPRPGCGSHPGRGPRPGQRPGRRPPWWPAGEAWPPPDGRRSVRRRFVRRILFLLVGLVALIVVANVLWTALGPRYPWWQGGPGPGGEARSHFYPLPWLPVVIIVIVAAVAIIRVLRRTAEPVGDVMEAAGRLAGGDYAARVEVRGSGDVRRLIDSFNEMAERLQTNEEQRRALLAEIAHELRTPLSVMHGDVEGMLDGVYPRDDEHLRPILAATERATRLLEDLQLLSTAQAGALRLHREPTDAAALVEAARAAFAPLAAERGVALTAEASDVPQLDADPVRLRQVLDNLVANALRFTPAGGSVAIEVRSDGRAGDRSVGPAAVFGVRDTGAGIPAEQLPHLFERFSTSGDAKGSGLGLAIARTLVEGHGGTIAVESEPGRGTTITFTIPLITPPS